MNSPICTVDGYATTNGVDVAASSTVTIALFDTGGVSQWNLTCLTTDELNSAVAVNTGLTINQAAKTATFTAPSQLGSALIFQSKINNGVDVNGVSQPSYTTTFKVSVETATGLRVGAFNETMENSATSGSAGVVNAVVRACSSLASASVGGDLSGSLPNPTVAKLQGHAVSSTAPTLNQTMKWNGSAWIPSPSVAGFYGDGSAGAVSYTSGTTTLTADVYATTISVSNGATLITSGFSLFATTSITNSGLIKSNGGNASGATGGTSLSGQSGGGAGATGSGNPGTGSNKIFGGAGSNGGMGGTPGFNLYGLGRVASVPFRQSAKATFAPSFSSGGGGGGSGGGDGTNLSGGGGAGGDIILICSPIIINNASGTIESLGGNGGNASATGNSGGGGAGGGGCIYLIGQVTNSGTISVSAGSPGNGNGSGAGGAVGNAGNIIILS